MATSNMAENHPVGFQWVMKAKERGAKLIHVDPRFTRTSAAADVHVPIRSGTNIVFFGGLIAYAIEHDLYFKDYVVHYTNASFLIDPAFKTPTDLDGLFTGFDPDKRTYDRIELEVSARRRGQPEARPHAEGPQLRLPAPAAPLQPLHPRDGRARLRDPEGQVRGGRPAVLRQLRSREDGDHHLRAEPHPAHQRRREHPGAVHAPAPPRQHRPAGRRRGRAARSRQRAGRHRPRAALPRAARATWRCRSATCTRTSRRYLEKETPKGGFWVNKPKFIVSLLKAFYGDAATKDNDFGYDWLPKRAKADAYSHQHIFVDMYNGEIKGFLADGQNPAVGGPNAKLARAAMAKLDWLVVEDIFLTETAEFWKAPGVDAEGHQDRGLLPARRARRREGRLADQHDAAHPVAREGGEAARRRALRRRLLLQPGPAAAEALRRLRRRTATRASWAPTSRTATSPSEPDMELVLREINGFATEDITDKDGKVVYKKGQPLNTFAHLTDDGKTACGCWIYTGVTVEGADGKLVNKASRAQARRREGLLAPRLGLRVAGQPAHPLQPRRGRPRRASRGASRRSSSGGIPTRPAQSPTTKGKWVGIDVPDFNAFLAPDAKNGDKPFIMRADLVGALLRPARRRAVPRALRAGRVAGEEPRSRSSRSTRGQDLGGAGPEERPRARRLAGLSVRHHDLPAHRASPVGRHVALPADARRAAPLALRRDQPRAGEGARASTTAT